MTKAQIKNEIQKLENFIEVSQYMITNNNISDRERAPYAANLVEFVTRRSTLKKELATHA